MKEVQIELTEYVRPNGRPRTVTMNVDPECESAYNQIKQSGARLGFEVLGRAGTVYVFLEHPKLGDYVSEILPSKEDLKSAIEGLLRHFDAADYERWKRESRSWFEDHM